MICYHQWMIRRSQWTACRPQRMIRCDQPTVHRREWTVYYQARWISTRGDTGPWGELVSATIVK